MAHPVRHTAATSAATLIAALALATGPALAQQGSRPIAPPAAAAPGQPSAQAPAQPAPAPTVLGVWLDDTGKGAIEMLACDSLANPAAAPQTAPLRRLCGRIVWLKEATDRAGKPLTDGYNPKAALRQRPVCGLQVIGDAKAMRDGSFDEGWIYDPKEGKSYDVEVKLRSSDRLLVTGYLGTKFLSETFVWQRAPVNLARCDGQSQAAAPPVNAQPPAQRAPAPQRQQARQ